MQLLLDDNDFKNPNGLRFIAHFLCSAADTMDGGMGNLSINGTGKAVELFPATPGEGPTIDPHPAEGIDPASVFGKAPSVPAGTIQDPPTGAAPPVPVGDVSSGAAATTLSPPAPVQGAQTTGAPDAGSQRTAPPTIAADIASEPKAPAPAPGHIDKDGLPWDGRVHSDTRKLNADGTWRMRRNLDPAVKAAVYAEYRGAPKAPPQYPAAPPAPPAANTAPPPPANTVVPPSPMPVPNGLPVGVPNTGNATVVPASNFRELIAKINQNIATGRLTQTQVTEACTEVGAASVTELAVQPYLVIPMDNVINRLIGAPRPPA